MPGQYVGIEDAAGDRLGISASGALQMIPSDGGGAANIAVPGPNLGSALVVTTGTLVSSLSLNDASATGAGTVADFGAAKTVVTMVVTAGVGVSAGVVALEVSQDNVNWYRHVTSVTTNAPGVYQAGTLDLAMRYARANITTAITGGTIDATLMAA